MQTIEIITAQNVSIEYELASLRERFFALFIDLGIIFISYLIFILGIFWMFGGAFVDSNLVARLLFVAFPLGLFIFYQLFSEVFYNGQSLGKRATGIRVVKVDGKEPQLGDYFLRAMFHFIDTLFSFGIIGALLISSTVKRQRLGDMAANTAIIRLKTNLHFRLSDILNINTVENYKPVYPGVTKLSEQDMLLIKNCITRYHQYPNAAHRAVITQLSKRLVDLLSLDEMPPDKIGFLKTLIKDYIVLTR
jgi:uncharacterized RDD family membrane protein YckC